MKIEPEWIEWKGGERPVDRAQLVMVQQRDGSYDVAAAADFVWATAGFLDGDIIAYCPLDIEPYKPKPKWTIASCGARKELYYNGKNIELVDDCQRIADALNAAGVEL